MFSKSRLQCNYCDKVAITNRVQLWDYKLAHSNIQKRKKHA
jgi:hypothetical protein